MAGNIVQMSIYLESSPSLSAHLECPIDEFPLAVRDLARKIPVFIERLEEVNRALLNALCRRKIDVSIDGRDVVLKAAGSIEDFTGIPTPFGSQIQSGACVINARGARVFDLGGGLYWREGSDLSSRAGILDGYKIGSVLPSLMRAGVPTWSGLVDAGGDLVGGLVHWEEVSPFSGMAVDQVANRSDWPTEHLLTSRGAVYLPVRIGDPAPVAHINSLMDHYRLEVESKIESGFLFEETWMTIGLRP